jgi:hypothetical protein
MLTTFAMPLALVPFTLGACAETVSPEPLGDYQSWKRLDTYGELPGHGDSYRVIYINDIALGYAGGSYPEGSTIVKEVRQRAEAGGVSSPGDLSYLAVMRRIGPAPRGIEDEAGWLFTQISPPSDGGTMGDEKYRSLCWNRCHVAAPYAGAFLDYGK